MSKIIDGIIGHAIGDAMGVPTEFCLRKKLMENPVVSMVGYGSHAVPAGHWSDDTSMSIALIQSLIDKKKFDYEDIMSNFIKWLWNADFTPGGEVFDCGRTCLRSIRNYSVNNLNPLEAGQTDLMGNGNGSVMRILPVGLYAYYNNLKDEEVRLLVNNVSSLTHGHEISKLGCYIYIRYVMFLLDGLSKNEAYSKIKELDYSTYSEESINAYQRILKNDIDKYDLKDIKSTAYIVDTLEACFWMLLNTESYSQGVIGSINLGNDTDTIAAIVGSMAGVIYGFESIPKEWLEGLARKDYLIELAKEFENIINDITF